MKNVARMTLSPELFGEDTDPSAHACTFADEAAVAHDDILAGA